MCGYVSKTIKRIHSLILESKLAHQKSNQCFARKISKFCAEAKPTIKKIIKSYEDLSTNISVGIFVHMMNQWEKIGSVMEDRRRAIVNRIIDEVEITKSIYFTRQQWLDLENEYNWLLLLTSIETLKRKSNILEEKNSILADVASNDSSFDRETWQKCSDFVNANSSNKIFWRSILPRNITWNDYDIYRKVCDGNWFVCPAG